MIEPLASATHRTIEELQGPGEEELVRRRELIKQDEERLAKEEVK